MELNLDTLDKIGSILGGIAALIAIGSAILVLVRRRKKSEASTNSRATVQPAVMHSGDEFVKGAIVGGSIGYIVGAASPTTRGPIEHANVADLSANLREMKEGGTYLPPEPNSTEAVGSGADSATDALDGLVEKVSLVAQKLGL